MVGSRLLARAAKAFYHAGVSAKQGHETRRQSLNDAGRVLRFALGRPRDAAACHVEAASDAPTLPGVWTDALQAFEQASGGSHLRDRLRWLVDHASKGASEQRLVEHISALREHLDAEQIAWGF